MVNARHSKGFSFIELIITLTFFAIVITPLYTFLTRIGAYQADHTLRAQALILASNRLEQTCAREFDQLLPFPQDPQRLQPGYLAQTTIHYQGVESPQSVPGPSPLKNITITLSWKNSSDATENLTLSRTVAP